MIGGSTYTLQLSPVIEHYFQYQVYFKLVKIKKLNWLSSLKRRKEDIMRSRLNTAMNVIAEKIEDVTVEQFNSKLNGELITIKFTDGQVRYINTATNVISKSLAIAKLQTVTTCKLQNGRLYTVLNFNEYKNGTRIQLGTLVALAMDKYNGIVRDSYIGLDMNHKDRTGNENVYNYINNKAYNVEFVSKSEYDRQWRCVEWVQKNLNIHIGLSGTNKTFMDLVEFGYISKITNYISTNQDFIDNRGVVYLK